VNRWVRIGLICITLVRITGVKNGRNVAMLRIIMLTLLRAVVKGLRENVLVLKVTIAKKENGRRQRKPAKSTMRKKVTAKPGTPENTAVITVRKEAHAEPGTLENTAVITVRKKAHADHGTPENTVDDTIRRKNASGFKREQGGLEFLTPVEQKFVKRDGLGIHVASIYATKM